jgi:hypothetical protein
MRRLMPSSRAWTVVVLGMVIAVALTSVSWGGSKENGLGDGNHSASSSEVMSIVQIEQHMSRYTYLVDSRRPVEWANLFTPDAVLEEKWQDSSGELHEVNQGAGCRVQGREQIAQLDRNVNPPSNVMNLPRPAAGGHRIVDQLVEVDPGGTTATFTARGPGGLFQYENTMTRTGSGPDGGWQFSRVLIIFNEDTTQPCTANGPNPAS